MKKSFKDMLLYLVVIIVGISILITAEVYPQIQLNNEKSKFFHLEDYIEAVEDGMRGYSEYYVVATAEDNGLIHDMSGTEISSGDIRIVVPKGTSKKLVLQFYTGWDELIGTFLCNFDKYPVYKVNNKTISVVESSLPFMYMDVNIDELREMKKSYTIDNPEKKKIAVEVNGLFDGNKVYDDSAVLSPRGAATWVVYDKKPFTLKMSEDTRAYGLGDIKKFNLLANASDKTLLKNEIFFDLANSLGMDFTPRIRNVNMYINGSYEGIYSITSKVKVGKNTIPLSKGDFFISWQAPHYKNPIRYDCDFWIEEDNTEEMDYPYVELEWPENATESTKTKVHDVVQNYVDIIEKRKEGKLSDYIDLTSFAKYYWVQEIGMNADGLYRSAYTYYRSSTGKLYMGPLWDMEFVLGSNLTKENVEYLTPTGWKMRDIGYYKYLFQNEEFVNAVNQVYEKYNIEAKMKESYYNFIDKVEKLSTEGEINYQMWIDDLNLYDPVVTSNTYTYYDYCDIKLDFYKERIDWITQEMAKSKSN